MRKTSKVIPFSKKSDQADIKNYLAIIVLGNYMTLFELCLNNHLYAHEANYLGPLQHGFMSDNSTVSNVVSLTPAYAKSSGVPQLIILIYNQIFSNECYENGLQLDSRKCNFVSYTPQITHHFLSIISIITNRAHLYLWYY